MSHSLQKHIAHLASYGIKWQPLNVDDVAFYGREWASALQQLPRGAQSIVRQRWLKIANAAPKSFEHTHNVKAANEWGSAFVQKMTAQMQGTDLGLSLDATDSDIDAFAEKTAMRFKQHIRLDGWNLERQLQEACLLGVDTETAFAEQFQYNWLDAISARLCDKKWWKRHFRRQIRRRLEHIYRGSLNLVHKRNWLYVSDDAVYLRRQQKMRTAALMQSIKMINELGEEFALSELVEKSNANPAIRRAELMTRIAGFETIARDLGYCGEFITLTCPSRFHAAHHLSGAPNEKYDGSSPREASDYLNQVWSRIQAALSRAEITIYGFRVVEPHHDGCPHWHGLFFMQPENRAAFRRIVARYGCRSDREELGLSYFETATALRAAAREIQQDEMARGLPKRSLNTISGSLKTEADFWDKATWCEFDKVKARVHFEQINWNKGTAAGYIAKYIAKNIDGKNNHGDSVGEDFESADGANVIETAERVDAWASMWGIRQFQQIGGAPVSAWRELRRLDLADFEPNQDDLILRAAMAADIGDWGKFTMLMGGVDAKRAARPVQLFKETPKGTNGYTMLNQYGEPAKPVIRGVLDLSSGEIRLSRVHEWKLVQSEKCGSAAAWTCVNNSTKMKFSPDLAVNVKERKEVSADFFDDLWRDISGSLKNMFTPEKAQWYQEYVEELRFIKGQYVKGSAMYGQIADELRFAENQLQSIDYYNEHGYLPDRLSLEDVLYQHMMQAFDAYADAEIRLNDAIEQEQQHKLRLAAKDYLANLARLQPPVWLNSVAARREKAEQAALREQNFAQNSVVHHKFSLPKQYDTVESVLAEIEELLNETAIF